LADSAYLGVQLSQLLAVIAQWCIFQTSGRTSGRFALFFSLGAKKKQLQILPVGLRAAMGFDSHPPFLLAGVPRDFLSPT